MDIWNTVFVYDQAPSDAPEGEHKAVVRMIEDSDAPHASWVQVDTDKVTLVLPLSVAERIRGAVDAFTQSVQHDHELPAEERHFTCWACKNRPFEVLVDPQLTCRHFHRHGRSGHFWSCTRPLGHDGPHAACSTRRHELATWPQAPAKVQ